MQQTSKESSWGDSLNEDAIQGGSQGGTPDPDCKPLEDKRYEQDTQNPQMQQISKERSWEDSLNEDAIQGGSQGGPPDPDRKPLENDRYKQDTKWRDRLARWVVIVTSIWMLIILFILVIKGFCSTFDLEKEVLITLLATTTANVLGLPLIVLSGIFSEGKHPTKEHPSRPA